MILSNEPGYYKTGAYGIRIENLVLVIAAPAARRRREAAQRLRDADAGADRPAADRHPHADRRRSAHWLDSYHARVREALRAAARCRRRAAWLRGGDARAALSKIRARRHQRRTARSPASAPPRPGGLLVLLMAMTAIGPATLNILVPALPGLVARLGTDTATVQLTLSLYLLASPSAQLLLGPLVRPLRPPAGGAGRAGAGRRRLARWPSPRRRSTR